MLWLPRPDPIDKRGTNVAMTTIDNVEIALQFMA